MSVEARGSGRVAVGLLAVSCQRDQLDAGMGITKAARELSVAQPSVSKQIRRLEDELGAPLFHRMRGNVALTPAGEALLPLARRVLTDVAGAESEVRDIG